MTKKEMIDLGRNDGRNEFARANSDALLHQPQDVVMREATALASSLEPSGKREHRLAYVEEFARSYMASWRSARQELPEVQAEDRKKVLLWKINGNIASADSTLADWGKRYAENALDAFEWSDGAIRAAAEKDVALRMLEIVNGREGVDPKFTGVEAAIKCAIEQALRGARWPSHSTSAVSNLATEYKTAAWADYAQL